MRIISLRPKSGRKQAYKGENPFNSKLSREAYMRMSLDQRVLRGDWTELDWCWEEIRMLNASLNLLQGLQKDDNTD